LRKGELEFQNAQNTENAISFFADVLLGLVKDLLHWLLKYLKSRNVKDQFDN